MKTFIAFSVLMLLSGCAAMIPGLTQAMDDYVTDEAVCVTIDKASMQQDTDIDLTLKIMNKDPAMQPIIHVQPTPAPLIPAAQAK